MDRQPGKERVSGQHEPRDSHADERHHRDDRAGPGFDAHGGDQRECLETVKSSADSLLALLNDILDFSKIESQQLELETIPFSVVKLVEDTLKPLGAARPPERPRADRRCRRPTCRPGIGRRSRAASADHHQPGRQRDQVHARRGTCWCRSAARSGSADRVQLALFRQRHRHRHPRGQARHHLRSLQPGGRIDDPALRRHRPWPDDFADARAPDGRAHLGRERARRGQHVPVHRRPSRPSTSRRGPSTRSSIGVPVLIVDDNEVNRRIFHELLTRWQMKPSPPWTAARAALAALAAARGRGASVRARAARRQHAGHGRLRRRRSRWRPDPELGGTPIMMLTSSGQFGDSTRCRELGHPRLSHQADPAGRSVRRPPRRRSSGAAPRRRVDPPIDAQPRAGRARAHPAGRGQHRQPARRGRAADPARTHGGRRGQRPRSARRHSRSPPTTSC